MGAVLVTYVRSTLVLPQDQHHVILPQDQHLLVCRSSCTGGLSLEGCKRLGDLGAEASTSFPLGRDEQCGGIADEGIDWWRCGGGS